MSHELANPYVSPQANGSDWKPTPFFEWLWRIAWLGAAAVFFFLAVKRFFAGREMRQRLLDSGRLAMTPPTVLSEYLATGIVLICLGLICCLFAFRLTQVGVWWHGRSAG